MTSSHDRNILIVSARKLPAQRLKRSLNDIFGDMVHIDVHAYLEDGDLNIPILPEVTLASGENSYKRLLRNYPKESIIFAKRDVTLPVHFERVFLLPKDKKVLVINETYEGTLDTIKNLKDIGIDHLDLRPYWQDCGITVDNDIDTAISPGMLHICPQYIKNKIDIGIRQLSISVFVKILKELQLDLSYTEKFLSYNKAVLVDAYKRLSDQYQRKEKISLSLESILDNINEAIISVENKNIIECNPTAEKLLGFYRNEVLNKNINSVIDNDFWSTFVDKANEDKVLLYNNKKLYVSFSPLKTGSKGDGIFTFKETSEIEKLEESVRRILYKKDSSYTARYTFKDIIAESENIRDIISSADSMAKFDQTVLITGESGTGKELFAQSIHNASYRRGYPFIAVNFGAIPDNLVESELFGYKEGAFTGARKSGKKGLFELAHNGTIFLDEIGNSSTWIQSRLLRVLEEKELMRLGGTKIVPVNVRVVVATNKDLEDLIQQGLFREDLYYRLNVFPLKIPPLRERKECIFPLINHFLSRNHLNKTFSKRAYDCIMSYNWPGNIRELKNMVSYIGLANKIKIDLEDLPHHMQYSEPLNSQAHEIPIDNEMESIISQLEMNFDLDTIKEILNIYDNNITAVNRVGRNRILRKLASCGINLTESNIRTISNHLENHGLIIKGRTKQGTIISNKGKQLLGLIK